MRSKEWFVHLDGAVLGPLAQEAVTQLLTQNRVQFVDFAWNASLTKWMRLSDLDEFASLIPPYPKVPIPSRSSAEPAPAPSPVSTPTPTRAPSPSPAPVAAATPLAPAPAPAAAPRAKKATFRERVAIRAKFICSEGSYDIVNISEGGALLRSDSPLDVGTDLKFRIESKELEKTLEMTGVVIRHLSDSEEKGFAVEFTRVNPAHRRALQEFVKSKTASQGV